MAKNEDVSTSEMTDVMDTDASLDIRDPRVYEIGYLLVPQIKEEDLDAEIDAVRKLITDQGGLPIGEGRAELMDLQYPMKKVINNAQMTFTKGYFGWIKFDVSPEKTSAIKQGLDASDKIIRHLFVSTVRENTLIGGKLAGKFGRDDEKDSSPKPADKPKKVEEQPAGPIDEEKLDKQIDELVVEE